jgi:hypothetical protein
VELGHCNIIKVPTEEIKDWLIAGGIAP